MKRIVIATPFMVPEKGVLSVYAAGLSGAFRKRGDSVRVVSYGKLKYLPSGVRHLAYFFKVAIFILRADRVLLLDTWSVGMPAYFAARLLKKPYAIRIGGDFLWEAYVERTGEAVRLSEFYRPERRLSAKEKLIFRVTRSLVRHAHAVCFNTEFQRALWARVYPLPQRTYVLENYYPVEAVFSEPEGHVFVAANRATRVKNDAVLMRAFERAKQKRATLSLDTRSLSYTEHLERLGNAYATIIPSVSEVGSNIAIESVSRGRPFIMTDDTGTKERLGECGLFIDTRSEEALEQAILSLLNRDVYERLVEGIKRFSFTRSWDDIARELSGYLE